MRNENANGFTERIGDESTAEIGPAMIGQIDGLDRPQF